MSEMPVAVIGAGRLGTLHARVVSEIGGWRLAAVVDPDIARARAVASAHGAWACEDLKDLPDDVAAAIIATPTSEHHAVAAALLSRGLHILVEKPIARTAVEAADMVARAGAAGRVLMVGHSERFNPVMRALDRRHFEPRFIDSQRVSPFPFRGADVGVVLDMMIHDIDIILHLVRSAVAQVHAVGVSVIGDTEDLANARLVFENGVVANATASRMALKTERKVRVFSDDCYVSLDFAARQGRLIRPGPGLSSREAFAEALGGASNPLEVMQRGLVEIEDLVVDDEEPLVVEDRAFLAAVRGEAAPPVTGEHGRLAVETAERIVRSLTESRRRLQEGGSPQA